MSDDELTKEELLEITGIIETEDGEPIYPPSVISNSVTPMREGNRHRVSYSEEKGNSFLDKTRDFFGKILGK